MQAGKFYEVEHYYWLVFPTLDTAQKAARVNASYEAYETHAKLEADLWSGKFRCNVSFIEPGSTFILVEDEKDPYIKKILTGEGVLGWMVLDEYLVMDEVVCFKEAKSE